MPKAPGFIDFQVVGMDAMQERWGRGREFMLGAVNKAYRRIGRLLVPAVKGETPTGATRKLRNSTTFQILGKAEDMRMEIRQSAFSDDGFAYGVAVRLGTKPHFPPPRALVPWVRRKLGIGDEKEALSIAWAIAFKISRVGTKKNPYHERVFQSNVGAIRRIAQEEIVNVAARVEGR